MQAMTSSIANHGDTLAPLPIGFALLGFEFIFRMHRLSTDEIGLRDDAISAA